MSRFFISSGVNLFFPVFCPGGKSFLILSLLLFYLTFQAPAQNVFSVPGAVLEKSVPLQGSFNQNFIKTITYREGRTEVPPPGESFRHSEEIQYFDGLGRPSQTVKVGASPSGNDIIQPILYDAFGREAVRPLPYTGARRGKFRSDAGPAAVNDFYSSQTPEGIEPDKRAFTSVIFDNSALNHVVSQTGPGYGKLQAKPSGLTASGMTVWAGCFRQSMPKDQSLKTTPAITPRSSPVMTGTAMTADFSMSTA